MPEPFALRFRWHHQARLVDAGGALHGAGAGQGGVLPPRPAVAALQAAIGAPSFRIGGEGPLEAGPGAFETLTGGSTGMPRRIRRTQASWCASFAANAGLFALGPGARVAVLGDLIHSLALYGAAEGLHLGAEVHLLAGLRPDRQRLALAWRGVEVLYATPAQLRQLVEAGGPDLPALRLILVGGARLDAGLRAGLAGMTGAALREFYGAAESSFIALSDATTPEGAVGRAYPGVEIAIQDAEGGLGAVWVRSAYLAEGYAGPPGKAVWRDGWLHVGEVGRLEAGQLYLSGRADRRLRVAEQSVYPEEIEAALLALPGIRRAAVLGVPDPVRGEVPVAVLLGQGEDSTLLAELRARFGPLAAPRRLIWVSHWPELASGKTDLAALARSLG